MELVMHGRVGQTSQYGLADGAEEPLRLTRSGAQAVAQAHGLLHEAVARRRVFFASNSAATAWPNALSATATGFILSNPPGSGYILSLLHVRAAHALATPAGVVIPALAAQVTVATADITHTTPLIVRNALIGDNSTAVGKADSAATLASTPVFISALGGGSMAGSGIVTVPIEDQINGRIQLMPGTAIATFALTTACNYLTSMYWEEIPILIP